MAKFIQSLDQDADGFISYAEVEAKLDHVHDEIAPHPQPHHLHHESRDDEQRHEFLRSIIRCKDDRIPKDIFAQTVRSWKVPSMQQEGPARQASGAYMRSLPLSRRLRAYWAVRGPEYVFVLLVVSLQVGMGTWQLVKYATQPQWQAAFGWGVVLSKTSAGMLYPTLFFLILSMSRYLATFARRWYRLSRFINVDLSHSFHIKISIVALALSTTHTIGHLTGSFLYGSRPDRQHAVAALLGPDAVPRPYSEYASSLAGWTGIAAFASFWIISLLSFPAVRRWNYEIFQLGHLLMFPMIAFLMAHGTEALLQFPMLGYWLAFPTLLVLLERMLRFVRGFVRIPATLEVLDGETVCIMAKIPRWRLWPYRAGQYILLQVPRISLFQWHPITISTCIGNEMQVHIKTDGDWTSKLREMKPGTPEALTCVGIDGPFGAPAQRFYDFDQTIVVGSGIGITPFAGILADLQSRESQKESQTCPDLPQRAAATTQNKADVIGVSSTACDASNPVCIDEKLDIPRRSLTRCRRVDFHWIVRDRNHLLWFSDLLNDTVSSPAHDSGCLDLRIQTHVTQKRKDISTHVFRYLLEQHRTPSHPASPLTGLLNRTHFGRPDLAQIMEEHYESMQRLVMARRGKPDAVDSKQKTKVGVFFCGAPVVGAELADRCHLMTLRGREDRSLIEYHFMLEVFD